LLVTLQNPLAGVLGVPNAIPTTVIPLGSLITLSGAIGATGAAGVAGGASSAATYIVRTPDASILSATALDSFSSGYLKTQGSSGFGAVSTVATVPVGDISGVLPVAKGGTNLSTAPANKIPVGDGSSYLQKEIIGTFPIVVTNSAGNITLSAPSIAVFNYVTFTRRLTGDNFVAAGTTKNPFSLGDFPSGSWLTLDPASGFTAATGHFTVPYTGYYRIDAMFNLLGVPSATSRLYVQLRKNGSSILNTLNITAPSTDPYAYPVSINYIDQALVIGDFYEVFISSTTVDGVTVKTGSSFSVQRIQA
jgi:hypothetical protein